MDVLFLTPENSRKETFSSKGRSGEVIEVTNTNEERGLADTWEDVWNVREGSS